MPGFESFRVVRNKGGRIEALYLRIHAAEKNEGVAAPQAACSVELCLIAAARRAGSELREAFLVVYEGLLTEAACGEGPEYVDCPGG